MHKHVIGLGCTICHGIWRYNWPFKPCSADALLQKPLRDGAVDDGSCTAKAGPSGAGDVTPLYELQVLRAHKCCLKTAWLHTSLFCER